MGIAVGKKCKACGCGGVLVKYYEYAGGPGAHERPEPKLQFDCCACDYRWTEVPLYASVPPTPYRTLYAEFRLLRTLAVRLAARKERSSTKKLTLKCFHETVSRIAALVERPGLSPLEHLAWLESMAWADGSAREWVVVTGYTNPAVHSGKATVRMHLDELAQILSKHLHKKWSKEGK